MGAAPRFYMLIEPSNFAAGVTGFVAVVTVICHTVEKIYDARSGHVATLTEQLEKNRQTTADIVKSFNKEE